MSTHHHTTLGCRDTCVTSNNKIIIKYLSLEHGLKVHTIWSWQRQEKIIWHQRQCTGTAVPLQRSHIITLQLNVMETEISTEISTGPLSRYLPVCRAQLCYSLQSTSQAWSGSPASQASHRRAAASISGNMNTYILDTAVIIQISEVIYGHLFIRWGGCLVKYKMWIYMEVYRVDQKKGCSQKTKIGHGGGFLKKKSMTKKIKKFL